MAHSMLCYVLVLALTGPVLQSDQPWSSDPEVSEGIRQVEEGDYDAAIVTLDRAAQRLVTDPKRTEILSYTYLYLGIAYMGKGHEAAAKAQFREAVNRIKDLTLSPADYPPKVIDLFEAAKEEAAETTPAAEEEEPAPVTPEEKEGGSKMPLILLGVGGGAAAAVAVGVSSGSDDSGSALQPVPVPAPPQLKTDIFPGLLSEDQSAVEIRVGPGGSGRWEAQLNYANGNARDLWMEVYSGGAYITQGRALTPTSWIAEWETDGSRRFLVIFGYDPEAGGPAPGNYELRVTYPMP